MPIEPITGILEMFKTHDVVALSEGNHGNEQGHAFRLALIRDPRFSAAVNDIVVEFGNAHYQAVIDRFVQGEPVAYEELRKVWQDTTQRGTVWDRPIYEEFYRAVRDVNAALPVERRLRVLLGDTPMDWYAPQRSAPPRTDDFPASVIQREVMAKKRRALVIYGGMHLIRKRTPFLPPKEPALAPVVATLISQFQNGSIVAQLDRLGARVFVVATSTDFDISTLQANVVTWRRPSLALIRGTPLGLASSVTYFPRSAPVIRGRGGIQETLQPDLAAAPPMQEVVDAILYLGPPSSITQSRLSRELCADPSYVKMRVERLTEFASSGMTRRPRSKQNVRQCFSDRVASRLRLRPQHARGFEPRGAIGRNHRRDQRDADHEQRRGAEDHRIGRAHFIQPARHETPGDIRDE